MGQVLIALIFKFDIVLDFFPPHGFLIVILRPPLPAPAPPGMRALVHGSVPNVGGCV